jgi:alkylation response protein AidB-like acyl-CoA dehydrogenase
MRTAAADHLAASSPAAAQLRDYLALVAPQVRAEWGTSHSLAARLAWQRALNEGGWAAPGWPAEYGGRGLGVRDRVACSLQLALADVPLLGGVLGLNNVAPALMAFGTSQQQASLPKILSTEELWCQGFSEPEAGSDLASLRTRAVSEGDEFVVNGQKIWTSEGMQATHCLLLARTDPAAPKHQGISAFTVDMSSPGIQRREIRQINGDTGFAEVFFTDVRVPRASLLGPLNGGWPVTVATLAHERAGVISMAAELEYKVSKQLLAALARQPASAGGARSVILRERVARCYASARVAGLLGMRALDAGEREPADGASQSLIKLIWADTMQQVAETLLELEADGGSYSEAAASYLYSRGATIAGGTTEILKSLAGERVLGLAREPRP